VKSAGDNLFFLSGIFFFVVAVLLANIFCDIIRVFVFAVVEAVLNNFLGAYVCLLVIVLLLAALPCLVILFRYVRSGGSYRGVGMNWFVIIVGFVLVVTLILVAQDNFCLLNFGAHAEFDACVSECMDNSEFVSATHYSMCVAKCECLDCYDVTDNGKWFE